MQFKYTKPCNLSTQKSCNLRTCGTLYTVHQEHALKSDPPRSVWKYYRPARQVDMRRCACVEVRSWVRGSEASSCPWLDWCCGRGWGCPVWSRSRGWCLRTASRIGGQRRVGWRRCGRGWWQGQQGVSEVVGRGWLKGPQSKAALWGRGRET